MAPRTNKKNLLYNLLFLVVCGAIFLFLWSAPKESTPHLPNDDNHLEFMHMDKKEAEMFAVYPSYDEFHQQSKKANQEFQELLKDINELF